MASEFIPKMICRTNSSGNQSKEKNSEARKPEKEVINSWLPAFLFHLKLPGFMASEFIS